MGSVDTGGVAGLLFRERMRDIKRNLKSRRNSRAKRVLDR